MGGGVKGEVELSFQGHGHVERGAAHCHGHGHERRRPKSFWPMQGACAGSLSLSLSLQQSLRTLSAAIVVGFNVLCSPCPCVDTLPGLRFLHVFVFCGCANRESSTPEGRGEREVAQGLFGLMTCGLNFPCPFYLLYCLLWFFARQPLCSYSILYGA